MRSVVLAGAIILTAVFGSLWLLKPNNTEAGDIPNVLKISNEAVAQNEKLNKALLEKKMDPAEQEVFRNDDTSDMAESERLSQEEASKILLDHVKKSSSLLSVDPYKKLELYNVNTRETLEVVFWADGEYIPEALDELDQFMRDWRRNQVIDIDPELYVLMNDLYENLDADAPIHLISGHRSKVTNDKLRAMGRGTAKKSQHVLGKAADISIPGIPLSTLRHEALKMKEGGVGYYPKSGFVHVDTGRVRQW